MGLYPPCAVEGAMKNTSRDRAIDRWADQLHPGGRDHRGESSSAAAATGCLDGRLKRPSPPRVPWARVEQGCDGSGRRTATATGSISWRSGPNQRGWGGAARGEEGVARSAAAARDPYPGRGPTSASGRSGSGGNNDRFTVEPAPAGTALVPPQGAELEKIFSRQETGGVRADNTVSYRRRRGLIEPQAFRCSRAPRGERVWAHRDGSLSLYYGVHRLGR